MLAVQVGSEQNQDGGLETLQIPKSKLWFVYFVDPYLNQMDSSIFFQTELWLNLHLSCYNEDGVFNGSRRREESIDVSIFGDYLNKKLKVSINLKTCLKNG